MIKIELGKEVSPGIWEYAVPAHGLRGRSRQPLLDACRELQRILGPTVERAGLFREGSGDTPDLTCGVGWGADHTVSEPQRGGVNFVPFRPWGGM